jgi:ATP-dependent DNA helicase PIF1
MDTTDILLLLIPAVIVFIVFMIALLGYILYKQQSQTREQNEKIKRLERALNDRISSESPKVVVNNTLDTSTALPQVMNEVVADRVPEQKIDTTDKKSRLNDVSSPVISRKNTNLVITPEFQLGLELLNSDAQCIFITGKAGTGKSSLLTHFVETTNKSVALLAPTGMAALKISGQTIHSFFGFPPKVLSEEDIKVSSKRDLYRAFDTIVIDEISMVRTDMLDAIDQFLRLNGKDMQKPFGGIQMVFFGDLYQLPPVVSDEDETMYLASNYDGSFFFAAHVLEHLAMEKLELTKVFRQNDQQFIDALNAIRTSTANKEMLEYINQRYEPAGSKDRNAFITLVTRNDVADWINRQELNRLLSQSFTYSATLEGEFTKEKWKKKLPADLELVLKLNSQVIFIKNDKEKRWLNGNMGKVVELGGDYIKVELEQDGGRFVHEVSPETWELIKYKFDRSTFKLKSEVVGKFTQYPVRLGWAITIHKSQGATLDRAHIDLGTGAFASGQTYVALSRCKSLQGITLEQPIMLSDIKGDASVKRFMASAFPETEFTVASPSKEVDEQKNGRKVDASRFVSDKIDEEHKYTQPHHRTPDWFVDETVNMILPLFSDPRRGVNLRTYHGECKVYIRGELSWIAKFTDIYSVQAFWKRIQSFDEVSVEPIHLFQSVRLSNT